MERITNSIVKSIENNNPRMDSLRLKTIEFGLRCLLSEASKLLLYLIIFSFFSLTKEFIIALIFFTFFRGFAGGYHAETYWKCFFITLGTFGGIVLLGVKVNEFIEFREIVLLVTIALTFIYAPVDHPNKPIISRLRRKKLKIVSIIFAFLMGLVALLLPKHFSIIATIALFAEGLSLVAGNYIKRGNAYGTDKRTNH